MLRATRIARRFPARPRERGLPRPRGGRPAVGRGRRGDGPGGQPRPRGIGGRAPPAGSGRPARALDGSGRRARRRRGRLGRRRARHAPAGGGLRVSRTAARRVLRRARFPRRGSDVLPPRRAGRARSARPRLPPDGVPLGLGVLAIREGLPPFPPFLEGGVEEQWGSVPERRTWLPSWGPAASLASRAKGEAPGSRPAARGEPPAPSRGPARRSLAIERGLPGTPRSSSRASTPRRWPSPSSPAAPPRGSACEDDSGLPSAARRACGCGCEQASSRVFLCLAPAGTETAAELERAAAFREQVERLCVVAGGVAGPGA